MKKTKFWDIFPTHGKFEMASQFNAKRMKAVVLTRWMMVTKGLI